MGHKDALGANVEDAPIRPEVFSFTRTMGVIALA
jgi:hypothetical protein